jgi:hypothetical protein
MDCSFQRTGPFCSNPRYLQKHTDELILSGLTVSSQEES